jgi:hypothetical protein
MRGSLLGDRDLADRRDSARAALEAGTKEPMDGIDVVGFDHEEERVLRVGAVATDQLDALYVRVEQ